MQYKGRLLILLLVVISFVPLFDLYHPGLPLTHDGQDHVARIANFYQNLREGNIIPRWAGNLNWGYGHPILEFLYPLPSYFASLFHSLGFTLVDSVKIVFGLGFIASGLAMYIWLKEFLGTKSAFIGAILYMFAPYRFVDLYVRGAIGEHVVFIFPPLIFYFLLKLSQLYRHSGDPAQRETPEPPSFNVVRDSGQARMTGNYWFVVGGSFSVTGLILSHNAIMIMFLPIIFLYAIYIIWQSSFNKYLILNTLYLLLLGFSLSSFFLVPAFFEGKYTLRDVVTSGGEYIVSFVMWKDFFYPTWSYGGTLAFSKQIGIVHWIGIFGSVIATYYLYKNKNKLWIMSLGGFLILGITLFLMTSVSNPIWQSITLLQKFQFPWRFLSVTVFVSSVIGALVIYSLSNKLTLRTVIPAKAGIHELARFPIKSGMTKMRNMSNKVRILSICMLVLAVLFFNKDYWHANGFLHKPESFYSGIYNSTTDTGESSPIWSVRFMEKRAKANMEVIAGEAEIEKIKRTSTIHEYKIIATEKSRIRENTLYFPGWNVYVDGKKTEVEFQDQKNRGLITFFVEKGENDINIKFKETKLRLFANTLSVLSLLFIITLAILKKTNIWRRFR